MRHFIWTAALVMAAGVGCGSSGAGLPLVAMDGSAGGMGGRGVGGGGAPGVGAGGIDAAGIDAAATDAPSVDLGQVDGPVADLPPVDVVTPPTDATASDLVAPKDMLGADIVDATTADVRAMDGDGSVPDVVVVNDGGLPDAPPTDLSPGDSTAPDGMMPLDVAMDLPEVGGPDVQPDMMTTSSDIRVMWSPSHSCAWQMHGKLYCWGTNVSGELGTGAVSPMAGPTMVPGLVDVVDVGTADAGSRAFTCAVSGDGHVACWGSNWSGQLGDGTLIDRARPVAVVGITDAVAVATAGSHACALRQGGAVMCWGNNRAGEIGDGTGGTQTVPVAVINTNLMGAVSIAAGFSHSCARRSDGTVWCWGANGYGEVGNGTMTSSHEPVKVVGIDDAVEMVCGPFHTCARRAGNRVSCWGTDEYGELGDGRSGEAAKQQWTPVDVVGVPANVAELSRQVGTCLRTASGAVWCWGYQLDVSNNGIQSTGPTAVPGQATSALRIAGTCLVTAAARVQCWGFTSPTAAADGTTTSSGAPLPVLGLPF